MIPERDKEEARALVHAAAAEADERDSDLRKALWITGSPTYERDQRRAFEWSRYLWESLR